MASEKKSAGSRLGSSKPGDEDMNYVGDSCSSYEHNIEDLARQPKRKKVKKTNNIQFKMKNLNIQMAARSGRRSGSGLR